MLRILVPCDITPTSSRTALPVPLRLCRLRIGIYVAAKDYLRDVEVQARIDKKRAEVRAPYPSNLDCELARMILEGDS